MVYRKHTKSDFVKCSKCGGKAYKVGTDFDPLLETNDDYTIHCWECDNVDSVVTVDF